MKISLSILLVFLLHFTVWGQMAPITVTPNHIKFEPFPALGKSYRVYEYTFELIRSGKDTLKDVLKAYAIDQEGNIAEEYVWHAKKIGGKSYLHKYTYQYDKNRQIIFEATVRTKPSVKRTATRSNLSSFRQLINSQDWIDSTYTSSNQFYPNGLIKRTFWNADHYNDTIPYQVSDNGKALTSGYHDDENDNRYRMSDSVQIKGDTTRHWQRRGIAWTKGEVEWGTHLISEKVYHAGRNAYLILKGYNNSKTLIKYTYNKAGFPILRELISLENERLEDWYTRYYYDELGLLERKDTYYKGKLRDTVFYDYEF